MFKWLKRGNKADTSYIHITGSKPLIFDNAPVVRIDGEITLPKSCVSDPVITLLEMLKCDDWEIVTDHRSHVVICAFLPILKIKSKIKPHICLTLAGADDYHLCGFGWMTEKERKAVISDVVRIHRKLSVIEKASDNAREREEFKQLIFGE